MRSWCHIWMYTCHKASLMLNVQHHIVRVSVASKILCTVCGANLYLCVTVCCVFGLAKADARSENKLKGHVPKF